MADNTRKNMRENMARKLKEARQNAGLTAKQVGAQIGKSDKTVHAWEAMHGQPDADMLIKLCEIYGVEIQFFYLDDEPDPEQPATAEERFLLTIFRGLNDEGRKKVLTYAEDLSLTGRY